MSTISNIHTSVVYAAKGAGKTVAFVGQRLVVTIAKADKSGNYGPNLQQTMATSIPMLVALDVDWTNSDVQAACVDYLQSVQNEVIADRIKTTGTRTHTSDELSVSACVDYLARESVGDKWDAIRVAGWFVENIADYLGIFYMTKNSDIDDDELKIKLNTACVQFSDALGTKSKIKQKAAVVYMKLVNMIPDDKQDRVAKRFLVRLDPIANPVEIDLAEELGL